MSSDNRELMVAHQEGVEDAYNNCTEADCSFPKGSDEWSAWMQGFYSALSTITRTQSNHGNNKKVQA